MLVVSFVSGIYIPNALPTFPPETLKVRSDRQIIHFKLKCRKSKKLANAYIIGHTIKVQKRNMSAHAAGQVTEFFHRHPFSFDNFPHSLRKSANCVGNTVSFGTKVVDCHGRAAHLSR